MNTDDKEHLNKAHVPLGEWQKITRWIPEEAVVCNTLFGKIKQVGDALAAEVGRLAEEVKEADRNAKAAFERAEGNWQQVARLRALLLEAEARISTLELLADQAQSRAEAAEAEVKRLTEENARLTGQMCLICGASLPCELSKDETSPCTFDPNPVEAAKMFLQRAKAAEKRLAEAEGLRTERHVIKLVPKTQDEQLRRECQRADDTERKLAGAEAEVKRLTEELNSAHDTRTFAVKQFLAGSHNYLLMVDVAEAGKVIKAARWGDGVSAQRSSSFGEPMSQQNRTDSFSKNGIRLWDRVVCIDALKLHGTVIRCAEDGVDVRWDDGSFGELVWDNKVANNAYRLQVIVASPYT